MINKENIVIHNSGGSIPVSSVITCYNKQTWISSNEITPGDSVNKTINKLIMNLPIVVMLITSRSEEKGILNCIIKGQDEIKNIVAFIENDISVNFKGKMIKFKELDDETKKILLRRHIHTIIIQGIDEKKEKDLSFDECKAFIREFY